ncbi:MAG: hypothetical protein WCH85_11545 [Methanomicrobiales archaeon]
MDNQIMVDEPCEPCGVCCRIFGPGIAPTVPNVYVWMEQGRTDILRWFITFMEKSTPVNCATSYPGTSGKLSLSRCAILITVSMSRYVRSCAA